MPTSVTEGHFYRYPKKRRYLSARALDFWDAVHYLAEKGGGEFVVTVPEIARLMAGSGDERCLEAARQAFVRLRRQAVAGGELLDLTSAGGLVEESPLDPRDGLPRVTHRVGPGAFYHLALPNWDGLRQGVIIKPFSYVEFGWAAVLGTALARRMINFFLSRSWRGRDDPKRRDADIRSTQGWTSEFIARHSAATGKSPSRRGVKAALELLRGYGLLVEREAGLEFHWQRLLWPPEAVDEASLADCRNKDPLRAAQAEELLRLARLPWRDLARVFRDLARFDGGAYRVLRGKAYGWREEPDSPAKWSRIVRSARAALREMEGQRLRRIASESLVADLAWGEEHRLSVGFSQELGRLQVVSMHLAVRLVARDWALRAAPTQRVEESQVEVWLESRWGERVAGSEWRGRVRSDLGELCWSADLSAAAAILPSLSGMTLVVRGDRPTPWCKVTARLVVSVR